MDNRGIDQEPGWINRQLRELRQAIEALRSERRAAATEINVVPGATMTGFVLKDEAGLPIFEAIKNFISGTRVTSKTDSLLLEHVTSGATFEITQAGEVRIECGATRAIIVAGAGPVDIQSDTLLTLGGGLTNAVRLNTAGTTGSSANLYRAINGELLTVVSSRRYKQDIADHDIDPLSVLKMRVRTWRDRGEVEKDADTTQRYIGFIAEELHDLGLTEFVSYDEQGRPDAVAYDRIPVALLIALRWLTKQVRDERARTDALEAKVASQQQQIAALTARLDAMTTSQ